MAATDGLKCIDAYIFFTKCIKKLEHNMLL